MDNNEDKVKYDNTAHELLKILNGMSYHDIEETIYVLKKLIDDKSTLISD